MRGNRIGRRLSVLIVTTAVLGLMGASLAFAVTVIGPNYEDPAAAYNSTENQYLLVGFSLSSAGLDGFIKGPTGSPVVGPFVIDERVDNSKWCETYYVDEEPAAVAYNSRTNQYVVVWEDRDADNDQSNDVDSVIKAVRVDKDGNVLGPAVTIADAGVGGFRPDVAYNSVNNVFLFVWVSRYDNYMSGRPAVADLSSMGVISNYAPAAGAEYDEQIAVAYSPADNQFLVVFETEYEPDGPVPDIQGRYADGPTGSPLGAGPFVIDASNSTGADDPRVAYDAVNNRYLVVWEDAKDPNGDESDELILGRIVLGNQGGVSGGNIEITSREGDSRDDPDVAFCAAGNKYLVVFENNDEGSIEAQFVSASGELQGDVLLLADDPGPDPSDPYYGEWDRDDPRVEFNSQDGTFFVYFENDYWYEGGTAAYECYDEISIEATQVPCEEEETIIPTLGQWGAIVMSIVLGGAALLRVRRRKKI